MADAMKLLPCPFCGGRPGYSVEGFVFCHDCGCEGAEAPTEGEAGMARRDAIEAWNRRASPPAREEAPAEAAGDFSVDALAQEIRRVDGNHNLGAGALAEALMPFLRDRTSEPARETVAWGTKDGIPDGETVEVRETDGSVSRMIVGSIQWRTMLQDLGSNVAVRRFTHPAPATANKLRVAKEALIRAEDRFERLLLLEEDDAVSMDIASLGLDDARQALATLNEEGNT